MSRGDTLTSPDKKTSDKTDNTYIPKKESEEFVNSSLNETDTEIISNKPIRSAIIAPTGITALSFDDVTTLGTNSDSLEFQDCITGNFHEILSDEYSSSSGSEALTVSVKSDPVSIDLQPLSINQSSDFESFITSQDQFIYTSFYAIPRAAGEGEFSVRDTDANGCIMNSSTKIVFESSDIGNEVLVVFTNRLKIKNGQTIWIKYTGPAVAGYNYVNNPIWGTQFVPYIRAMVHEYENKTLALLDDVPNPGNFLDKATYDPSGQEGNVFDMDNMVESSTSKIFTSDERNKLSGLSGGRYLGVFFDILALQTAHPTGNDGDTATVTDPDGNLFFWDGQDWSDSGTGHYGDMLSSIYDPSSKSSDVYSMDNMEETPTRKIFTDVEKLKLINIESGAQVNPTDIEIKTQYENNANTNPFTDAEKTKLAGLTQSTGDMEKSVYDTNSNGTVDDSESLAGQLPAYYLSRANHIGTQTASTINDFETEVSSNSDVTANTAHRNTITGNPHNLDNTDVGLSNVTNEAQIPLTEKGVANGVATLDSSIRLTESQLSLISMKHKGDYDIISNTPILTDATGIKGEYYRCSSSGSRNFGSGTVKVRTGERLLHNGSIWQNGGIADTLDSLNTDDIDEGISNLYFTEERVEDHEFDSIKFDVDLPVESYLNGRLGWDPVNKCPYYFNDRPEAKMNIGRELWARSANNTGSQIISGKVLYISNIDSGLPEISLAQPDEYDKCQMIGVATEDIDDGGFGVGEGEVTSYGLVKGINTNSLILGPAYLDTDGSMTSTRPTGTMFIVFVGTVLVSDPVNGVIFVNPNVADYTVEVVDTNGFPSQWRTGSIISFVNLTRIFTIAPTGSLFHYYINGDVYKVTISDSIIISDVEGLHVIYYDGNALSEIANPDENQYSDIWLNKCPVSVIYWDFDNKEYNYIADERHGISMSPATHAYNHITRGTQYVSGLGLGGVISDASGDLDTSAQFSIEGGKIVDEDLQTVSSPIGSTVGLPIYYLEGPSNMRRKIETGFSVLTDITAGIGITGRLVWNEFTGGSWQLSTVSSGNYVLCHVFAINGISGQDQQVAVIGQNEYSKKLDARVGASSEISSIMTGFPMLEIVPVSTIIFETKDTFANTVKSRIISTYDGEDYVSWLKTELSSGQTSSHSNLADLQSDTHQQYKLLEGRNSDITVVNSSTYTILSTDVNLHIDYTAIGPVTITWPSALMNAGREVNVKDTGGNAGTNSILIETEGAETIDGNSNFSISVDRNSYLLIADGLNLKIKASLTSDTSLTTFEASAISSTTTSSTTDVLIDSMSIIPGAGNFLVWFSTSVENGSNETTYISLYNNGVKNESSERRWYNESSIPDTPSTVSTQATLLNIQSGQSIEARWRTTNDTAIMYQRTLTLLKI